MFQRFLLAIDGSPSGDVAVDFAIAVAQRCSASVHVLVVNERMITARDLLLLTHDEATDLITDAVDRFRDAGIEAAGAVRPAAYRQVPARISEEARERNVDAIVLGSRRRRRLGRLFASQVRERTTRFTSLPVLTAPSPLEVAKGIGGTGGFDRSVDFDLEKILRTSQ